MGSYVEDRLYGGDLEVGGPPVLRPRIQASLQDVQLPAESGILKRHPPAGTQNTSMRERAHSREDVSS